MYIEYNIWPDMLCKGFKNIFPTFQVKLFYVQYFIDILKTYLNIGPNQS